MSEIEYGLLTFHQDSEIFHEMSSHNCFENKYQYVKLY